MDKVLVDKLGQPLVDIYNSFEYDLLMNISGKLADKKSLLDTDPLAWQLQMMQNLGLLTKENMVLMSQYSKLPSAQLNALILNAGLEGLEVNEEIIAKATKKGAKLQIPPPVTESPTILKIMAAYQKQAKDIFNLTNQTMVLQAGKIYTDIINRTALDVLSGTMTGDQALRKTIKQWAEQGVPALVKNGRHYSPEGYVRTVLRTTVGNVTNEMQDARFDEYGVEYVEISSHAGARPKCAPYQGRVFSLKTGDKKYAHISTTSQGQVDGLFGINCGHTKYAFVPGVSTQTYQSYDTEENAKQYKESQQQRAIERSIRKAKTNQSMLKAAGDDAGAKDLDKVIALRQAKMRKFTKDTGRTRRSNREQIVKGKMGMSPLPPKSKPAAIKRAKAKVVPPTPIPVKPVLPVKPVKPVIPVKPKTIKPVVPKPVKPKPVPQPIDNRFTKKQIIEANEGNIDDIGRAIKKYPEDAAELKALLKEYKSGQWDHTVTSVGIVDGKWAAIRSKPLVKSKVKPKPKPVTPKPKPAVKPVTPKPVDIVTPDDLVTINKKNMEMITNALKDKAITKSEKARLNNLLLKYKFGKYSKIKTNVILDDAGRIKVIDNNPKVKTVRKPKAKPGSTGMSSGELKTKFAAKNYDELVKIVDDMPVEVKALFDKYGDRIKVNLNQGGGSHYSPGRRVININDDGIGGGARGKYATLFHEIGHLFDTEMSTRYMKISSSLKYLDSIEDDYKALLKRTKESSIRSNFVTPTEDAIFRSIAKEVNALSDASSGIQDVIGGISNKKIKTRWGHSLDYWNRGNRMSEVGSELFAHMVQATTDPATNLLMKKYFPSAYKEFFRMIKGR